MRTVTFGIMCCAALGVFSQALAQETSAAAGDAIAPAAEGASLSLASTVGEVARYPEGREILERLFPGLAEGALVQEVSVGTISNSLGMNDEQRAELNAELRAISR